MSNYEVSTYEENGLTFIRLSGKGAFADICPERGGIVSAFRTLERDVLYINTETLFNRSKNVRGGIPVLFPMGGQLTNGSYPLDGKCYKMANHGLARTRPFTFISSNANDDRASLKLSFASDDETFGSFPFNFNVIFTYELAEGKLSVHQEIENRSDHPMPVYPGYHPYFGIKNKQLTVETTADQYLDYNDLKTKPFDGHIDMAPLVEPVVFQDTSKRIACNFDDSTRLVIEKSPEYRYIVLWTEEDKDYVCVEPWTAKKDEYNSGKELIYVPSEASIQLSVTYSLEAV
ncbi:aldose epimerase [Sporolactobacillus shoreicorticis]|uniref:Aldose epimerase n=1 Tax=Sporolactobacillus shoreicorticis TaxID=1923877 RepID=A0ABW5S0D2_9BACL|nr:aldose epimerase [Sporolactobacillus shoreicorticis]MCO7124638.1 aldose epimerase [Sporolactobacillus shoreicorticis]